MKSAVEQLMKRSGSSIIVLLSTFGMVSSPTMAPYIANKHNVFALAKPIALELSASNIRVNAIGLSEIDNRMMRSLESQFSPEDLAAWKDFVSYNIPMLR